MELRDYGTALRRYWKTWMGLTVAGLLIALAIVRFTTPTYQATAEVFVASSGEGTSGSQFVNQRVTSYPDIAQSRAVLGPVIAKFNLPESFASLEGRVTATNPSQTSQIDISVTDQDPVRASLVANAVANQFGDVVENLERPQGGESPVTLTVTNPAIVPSTPIAPVPKLMLPLGLVVGLALGAAAAIVRSRRDTRLYTADDVRAAWGADEDLTVYSSSVRRRRRMTPADWSSTLLARQLEPLAQDRSVRVLAVPASLDDQRAAQRLVDDVAGQLADWNVPITVGGAADATDGPNPAGVHFDLGTPLAPPQEWRRIAQNYDGVVLVVEPGRTRCADLREVRSILTAAEVPLFAAVLPSRRWPRRTGAQIRPAAPPREPATSRLAAEPAAPLGRS